MSGGSGTIFEELYSSYAAATTTTPAAAAAAMNAAMPPIVIPAGFMGKLGNQCSSLRLKIAGQMTATATVPTWKMGLAFTTTSTFAGTPTLGETATWTPAAGTGSYWVAEFDIGLRAVAVGAASTVVTTGMVEGSLLPSPFVQSVPAINVSPAVATWDVAQQYYLWPYLTLGAATAGNTVSVHMVKVYGEN